MHIKLFVAMPSSVSTGIFSAGEIELSAA